MNNNNNYRIFIFFIILSILHVNALDNRRALTPPMGWSSWFAYGCQRNCRDGDLNCLCETEIRGVADRLLRDGYVEAGYKYIILDDCWQDRERKYGRLRADPERFPRGMKDLANYLRDRGLKLGLFSDIGPQSGGRNPGSEGHLIEDAETFNEWGVEYVKMSGYTAQPRTMDKTYPEFGLHLDSRTTLACSWPYYQGGYRGYNNGLVDLGRVQNTCNTFRMDDDMDATWDTILRVVNHAKDNQRISEYVRPGSWIDLDLLMVGQRWNGLTLEQAKTQMVLWTMLASPLIFSANVIKMRDDDKAVLLDKEVIAIHQDDLGVRGTYLRTTKNVQIWTRQIRSTYSITGFAYALAFVNLNNYEVEFRTQLENLKLDLSILGTYEYEVKKIWGPGVKRQEVLRPESDLNMRINGYGTVLYRCEARYEYYVRNESRKQARAIDPSQRYYVRHDRQTVPEIIDDSYRGNPYQERRSRRSTPEVIDAWNRANPYQKNSGRKRRSVPLIIDN